MAAVDDRSRLVRRLPSSGGCVLLDFTALRATRDADDHEWRPTFMPHMKLCALTPLDYGSPSLRFLAGFAAQIAFLDQPKRALRVLRNEQLMQAYQVAVQREAKGTRHVRYACLAWRRSLMMLYACRPQHCRFRKRHGRAAVDVRGG